MKVLLIVSSLLIVSLASASKLEPKASCTKCESMKLDSEGGLANEYPRYMGTWQRAGIFNGLSFYECYDCMGLRDKLIFDADRWSVVDCVPGDVACGGSHHVIRSATGADGLCPYDDIGPWEYCSGDIIVGGGCTAYSTDEVARFTCL